jgi:hypothetical protein
VGDVSGEESVPEKLVPARVVVPTVAVAVTTSLVAVAVNLATEWQDNLWAWLVVGVLTLIGAVVSLWLSRRQGAGVDATADGRNELDVRRTETADDIVLMARRGNRMRARSTKINGKLIMQAGVTGGLPSEAATPRDTESDDHHRT